MHGCHTSLKKKEIHELSSRNTARERDLDINARFRRIRSQCVENPSRLDPISHTRPNQQRNQICARELTD